MKCRNCIFVFSLLVLFAFLFSGCGGSGGPLFSNLENDDPTYQQPDNDDSTPPPPQDPVDDPTEEPEPEEPEEPDSTPTPTPDDDAHYEPYPYTKEELIGLARSVVPGISFDVSLLEDEEGDEEDFTDAQYAYAAELSDEAKVRHAKKIVRTMWKHAIKLAVFPDSVTVPYKLQVPYNPDMKLQNTTTTHKSISQASTQKRYL